MRASLPLNSASIADVVPEFTGISSPYEAPVNPELTLATAEMPLEVCVEQIIAYLIQRGVVPHTNRR